MRKENDYYILFKGAKVNKVQANRIGVGVIFGIIGIILTIFLPYEKKHFINYLMLLISVAVGYFIVSPKLFK